MSKNVLQTGPKGLDAEAILQDGLELMEEIGPDSFSVRKLAAKIGCDPMAILYHFKSKRGLERAMADMLITKIRHPEVGQPWRACLSDVALQYRSLALDHPQSFPLLMRYWTTGPADFELMEIMFEALHKANIGDVLAGKLVFGFYASILGLALAEVGGLLKPPAPDIVEEIRGLPDGAFPNVKALLRDVEQRGSDGAFRAAIDVMLDGIEAAGRQAWQADGAQSL